MARELAPTTFAAALAGLADAAAGGEIVRIAGAGTKRGWAAGSADPDVEIRTTGLDRVVEHNAGDLTATLEAGAPLALAQPRFAAAGQMLAVDPDLGARDRATIGGIIASADSGPLRHRYGAVRDLILGITVALSDGTIARAGGKVIKNVAGYDLGKVFAGSFGTLGLILSVNVRLHPLPAATATAQGLSEDPLELAAAARALAAAPLELEALDVAWRLGRGALLARCGGTAARRRADAVARVMRDARLRRIEVLDDDAELWARQRAGQRSARAALVRVAARPSALADVLRAARASSAAVVGRAALGHSYLELDPDAVSGLIARLPDGAVYALLDVPPGSPAAQLTRWGPVPATPALDLMRRVKARFDPTGTCNPGALVGGI